VSWCSIDSGYEMLLRVLFSQAMGLKQCTKVNLAWFYDCISLEHLLPWLQLKLANVDTCSIVRLVVSLHRHQAIWRRAAQISAAVVNGSKSSARRLASFRIQDG
jgi:hypothetical protein